MKYRAEIDGLRALAVVPVILFHAGFEIFSGGFVGVDVFFVISGYLITTILIDDIENNRFSIVNFYERRARRILPALFFVIFICIPFAWLWMLPSQMKDFSESLVAVSLFASNILFWQESGYFAAAAEVKPLLHTWSLAVEEQYYVLFPIFLFLAWRFGKNSVFWMIVVFATISLALSEWGWRNEATANFYLAPTRAWELFAGSISAFIVQKRGVQTSNTLSLLGLVAIIFAIFFYDESTPFPSLYALVPVVGTALLVLFADKETLAAKILSTKAFIGIGLISYSAYLWHQPIFAFARIRMFETPNGWVMLFLSLMSLLLAFFSWRFVEQPFRHRGKVSRIQIFSMSAVVTSVLIAFGLSIAKTDYFEDNFWLNADDNLKEMIQISNFSKERTPDFVEKWQYGKCFYGGEETSFSIFDKQKCLNIEPEKKNVLLIGDSHAAQWYFSLHKNFPKVNILQATSSGCLPLLKTNGEKGCTDLRSYIFNEFLTQTPIDSIVLAARWDDSELLNHLIPTIEYLQSFSDDIYVLGPTLEYSESLPLILSRKLMFSSMDISTFGESNLDLSRWVNQEKFELSEKLSNIVETTTAKYIPIIDYICPKKLCSYLTDTGDLMAFDYGHLTLEGSNLLILKMKEAGLLMLDEEQSGYSE